MFPITIKEKVYLVIFSHKNIQSIRLLYVATSFTGSIKDAPLKSVSEKILEQLFERPDRKDLVLPLVVTYDSRLHKLSTFTTKHFRFLYAEEKVKKNFTPATFVSFCSGYSLRNHFIRAKVYPFIREKGTFCCQKGRCETCCNIKQTDAFDSFVRKNYKTNHSFNCDRRHLIYVFSYKVCDIQYVGSTAVRFRISSKKYNSY